MAVVVLSRIRGVTDRSTKGLFLVFTLLCLVCFASSLIEKDQLETLKDSVQTQREKLEALKEELTVTLGIYTKLYEARLDGISSEVEILKRAPPTFKSLLDAAERYRAEMVIELQKFNLEVEEEFEPVAVMLKDEEKKLRNMEQFITYLEETKAEL